MVFVTFLLYTSRSKEQILGAASQRPPVTACLIYYKVQRRIEWPIATVTEDCHHSRPSRANLQRGLIIWIESQQFHNLVKYRYHATACVAWRGKISLKTRQKFSLQFKTSSYSAQAKVFLTRSSVKVSNDLRTGKVSNNAQNVINWSSCDTTLVAYFFGPPCMQIEWEWHVNQGTVCWSIPVNLCLSTSAWVAVKCLMHPCNIQVNNS